MLNILLLQASSKNQSATWKREGAMNCQFLSAGPGLAWFSSSSQTKFFVYCGTATKKFLIEQCLFFSLVQMSGSCKCYTWERSIYKKAFFVEVTESSPVSEAYRKKKRNLSEGTKFRSDLKNSLIVEPVGSQAVWMTTCGQKRPLMRQHRTVWPKLLQLSDFIAEQTLGKLLEYT